MAGEHAYSSIHDALLNGDFARAMQRMLHVTKDEKGVSLYDKRDNGSQLTVDGIAGEYTVKGLQKWAGANPDGVIGPKTISAIKKKLGLADNVSEAQMMTALDAKLKSGNFYNATANEAQHQEKQPVAAQIPSSPSPKGASAQLKALHPPLYTLEPDDGHDMYSFKSQEIVIGDSIGYGSKHYGGLEGNTRKYRKPAEVLQVIQNILATDPNSLRGKNVILSTGLSNDTADMASAKQSIKLLLDSGANVVVDGLSDKRFQSTNTELGGYVNGLQAQYKAAGQPNRIQWGGALTQLSADNTHPTVAGYQNINAKAAQVFNRPSGTPAM